jgi:hypothetical protein
VCARCQAASILPQPPDLARELWRVRAWLVKQGAVPELDELRVQAAQHGHLYGDLSAAWAALGPGDQAAATVFVPDGAVLAHDPEAACAALKLARRVAGPVALSPHVPDSGRVLRELGLAAEADKAQALIGQYFSEAAPRQVLAGTPGAAAGLAELFDGLRVQYVASALAQGALEGRINLRPLAGAGRRIVLHPSAALLYSQPDYELVTRWLAHWLGASFCPEPDAPRRAWPAAVERPAIGLSSDLARRLAQHRLEQLLALGANLILTTDPFSLQALRKASSGAVEVHDLLSFAATFLEA